MNPNQAKNSEWLKSFVSPLIVGVVVLLGQSYIAPKVARDVKIEESILEQKYMVCREAFDGLLRRYERATISKGGEKIYDPVPTKDKLTPIEINSIYCRLALFCSSNTVPSAFVQLMKMKGTKIKNIGEFVTKVREEMGIKGEGVLSSDFNFAYSTKKPKQEKTENEPENN